MNPKDRGGRGRGEAQDISFPPTAGGVISPGCVGGLAIFLLDLQVVEMIWIGLVGVCLLLVWMRTTSTHNPLTFLLGDDNLTPYEGLAPSETAHARSVLHRFDSMWTQSFTYGFQTRETVRRLYDISDDVQDALKAIEYALPNTTHLLDALDTTARHVREDHWKKIEDLKARCGAPLLFPKGLEDQHYRKWWRAANDVLGTPTKKGIDTHSPF